MKDLLVHLGAFHIYCQSMKMLNKHFKEPKVTKSTHKFLIPTFTCATISTWKSKTGVWSPLFFVQWKNSFNSLSLCTCISEVQRVRLSLRSCIIRVLSLYDSSPKVSNSAIASSKACIAQKEFDFLIRGTTSETKGLYDIVFVTIFFDILHAWYSIWSRMMLVFFLFLVKQVARNLNEFPATAVTNFAGITWIVYICNFQEIKVKGDWIPDFVAKER